TCLTFSPSWSLQSSDTGLPHIRGQDLKCEASEICNAPTLDTLKPPLHDTEGKSFLVPRPHVRASRPNDPEPPGVKRSALNHERHHRYRLYGARSGSTTTAATRPASVL
ncbi:unnamed protein product, partial [Pleuronectes platessa]